MGNQITKQMVVDTNASFNEHQGAERIGLFDALGNPLPVGVVGESGRIQYSFEIVVNAEDSVADPDFPTIILGEDGLADLSTLPAVFKDGGPNVFGLYGEGSKNSFALPDGFGIGVVTVSSDPVGPPEGAASLEWGIGNLVNNQTILLESGPVSETTQIVFASGYYGTPDRFMFSCGAEATSGSWAVVVDVTIYAFIPMTYTTTMVA